MSNRLAELEQIHDALGYWDQEDYIEWLELSKAALEAENSELRAKPKAMERIRTEAMAVGAYFRYGPLLDALAAVQEEKE